MKKFFTYDPNTFRYQSTIEVNDNIENWESYIPDYSTSIEPLEISNSKYESYFDLPGNVWSNRSTEINLDDPVELARRRKISQLFKEYEAQFDIINQKYPTVEREGWVLQLEEAKAYLTSKNPADAPTLYMMVNIRNRGETLEDFSQSVIENNASFRQFYGAVTSQQQKMYADIITLDTVEQLVNYPIQWMQLM